MFRKFESVIKTVLVTAAHCIILHMVVVFRCFYGTVNSIEEGLTLETSSALSNRKVTWKGQRSKCHLRNLIGK